MNFRIADTFTDSLARLPAAEQKAAKTTAFDLQVDPASPGLRFHRVDGSKDRDFWSVRVNRDLRIIVHKTKSSLLLCYVDRHDDAYRWAERRRIERHPTTGAAQLVELRDTAEVAADAATPASGTPPTMAGAGAPRLFDHVDDATLLGYGVPEDWLGTVRSTTEDGLFDLAEHLPQEAAEALLDLAVGLTPSPAATAPADADPFAHPDAQRRFRILTNLEELEQALAYPWERWTVFLHPVQRALVERPHAGPARVSGSAGTGKTVVALHRAVWLARRDPAARVLLTTFSKALANALRLKLRRLAGHEAAVLERITVKPIGQVGYDLFAARFGQPNLVPSATLQKLLADAADAAAPERFSPAFLRSEWDDVVDAWQLVDWESYRDVARLGRKTRIGSRQRETLWQIFDRVRSELKARKLMTRPQVFATVTAGLDPGATPYDHVVVDEAQDIAVWELRFLARLAGDRPDGLFFTGDLGQRIFQQPFSWKSLGVDVRGRSESLKINYRTSHQIRACADRLLPPAIADVDGIEETRRGTISVFNGPAPEIVVCDNEDEEVETVAAWLRRRVKEGVRPDELGIFVRSSAEVPRARRAAKAAGLAAVLLTEKVEVEGGHVAIGTMHLAKGLEFRAVAVIACDDEVLPLQARIEAVGDLSDLEEIYNTERHLLYVACTRARDRLLISAVEPASEFLGDVTGA